MPRRLDLLSPPPQPWLETLGGTVMDTSADTHDDGGSSSNNLESSLLVISLILIAVVLLSLFIRYLNRSCCRSSADENVPSSRPPHVQRRRLVSPEVQTLINSLPQFPFESVTSRCSSVLDCAVCLAQFKLHDQLCALPLCCHAFHLACIHKWLASKITCPVCRSTIRVPKEEELMRLSSSTADGESFRLEIGSFSHGRLVSNSNNNRRSYSVQSLEYVVEEESEVVVGPLHRRGDSKCSLSGKKKDGLASLANIHSPETSGVHVAAEVAGGRAEVKQYVATEANSPAGFLPEVASGATVAPPPLVKAELGQL